MALKALILLTLLSRTPHHRDTESWDEREARMELVSEGIDFATKKALCVDQPKPKEGGERCKVIWPGSRKSLAMLLIAQAEHETHMSHWIHDNQCRLEMGECDSRKDWSPRQSAYVYRQQSFSPWQIKLFRDIPLSHWAVIEKGREGTSYAAWHAARRLASAYRACGTIEGAISRYALGSGCVWEESKDRAATYKGLMQSSIPKLKKSRDIHESRVRDREPTVIASRD